MKKILYAASEGRPYAASGGLSDVAESLPRALTQKGFDCRVIIPLYGFKINKSELDFIAEIKVSVAWRNVYCGIFKSEHNGVVYYFIDNDDYFKNPPMYEQDNECERFSFFSRAILEILPVIDFKPDIINCNDWQTALTPVYLNAMYSKNPWYGGIKTVFSIHNISFQGQYGYEVFENVLGLPKEAFSVVDYDKCINLMKGAIETADAVNTVSPRYLDEIRGEIKNPQWYDFGQKLTPIINKNLLKFKGILNGLDNGIYNPETDKNLYANYGAANFKAGKKANKKALQERLGLNVSADTPLVAIVSRIDSQQKGLKLILEAMRNGLLDNDMQFALLGSAAEKDAEGKDMECEFRDLEQRFKGRVVSYIDYIPELAQKIYAASDIFLVPSLYEPCGLTNLIALRYGSIPVVRETGGLADTISDSQDGKGNGFTFREYNGDDLKKAIERALNGYKNSKGWATLIRRAMECDFDWSKDSVERYIELYNGLT